MFDVFGDESAGDEFVVYGLAYGPEVSTAALAAEIDAIKARHHLAGVRLHGRVLFSPDRRRKEGLANVDLDAVFALYQEVAPAAVAHNFRFIAAQAKRSHFGFSMPAQGVWPRMMFGAKQLGVYCANAALIPLASDPGKANLRFWPDPDPTKIDWLGKGRQASRAIGGWVGMGSPDGPVRMSPEVGAAPLAPGPTALFELADFVAWMTNRLLSSPTSNLAPRLRALQRALNPTRVVLDLGPDGGMRARVTP